MSISDWVSIISGLTDMTRRDTIIVVKIRFRRWSTFLTYLSDICDSSESLLIVSLSFEIAELCCSIFALLTSIVVGRLDLLEFSFLRVLWFMSELLLLLCFIELLFLSDMLPLLLEFLEFV